MEFQILSKIHSPFTEYLYSLDHNLTEMILFPTPIPPFSHFRKLFLLYPLSNSVLFSEVVGLP